MAKNFPQTTKDANPQILEAQLIPNKVNTKTTTFYAQQKHKHKDNLKSSCGWERDVENALSSEEP